MHDSSDGNSTTRVADALAVVHGNRICEFTTVFRDGAPQTWPVTARLLEDVRILVSASTFPQKAYNIRRNPKVSLLLEPRDRRPDTSGRVLIRGVAVAEDQVISDATERPELAALAEPRSNASLPAG